MTREEYNAKVQSIQALLPNLATRIRPSYGKDMRVTSSFFEVYWDGGWWTFGKQSNPFLKDAACQWFDDCENALIVELTDALIKS